MSGGTASGSRRTQIDRHLSVITPLGEDALLLASVRGSEALGRLFRYELEVLSPSRDVDLDALVGQPITVLIDGAGADRATPRCLNGFVSRIDLGRVTDDLTTLHVEMVPWAWFLDQDCDCRIFQDQTTPEILQALFAAAPEGAYELSLFEQYPGAAVPRPVPGEHVRLREPTHGGGGHLLLLPARG